LFRAWVVVSKRLDHGSQAVMIRLYGLEVFCFGTGWLFLKDWITGQARDDTALLLGGGLFRGRVFVLKDWIPGQVTPPNRYALRRGPR